MQKCGRRLLLLVLLDKNGCEKENLGVYHDDCGGLAQHHLVSLDFYYSVHMSKQAKYALWSIDTLDHGLFFFSFSHQCVKNQTDTIVVLARHLIREHSELTFKPYALSDPSTSYSAFLNREI